MAHLNDLERHLRIATNRVRCPTCFSRYVDELCVMSADGVRFRFAPGRSKRPSRNKDNRPISGYRAKGRLKYYLKKRNDLEDCVKLKMICPLCGTARIVEFGTGEIPGIFRH
jgi:hypothetical protein